MNFQYVDYFTISNGKLTKKFKWSNYKYDPPIIRYQDYNGDGVNEIFLQLFHGGSSGMYSEEIRFLNASTLKEIKVEDPIEYICKNTAIKETKKSMCIELKNGNAFYNLPRNYDSIENGLGRFVSYKVKNDKIMAVVGSVITKDLKHEIYAEVLFKFDGVKFVVKSAKLKMISDGNGMSMISE